MTDAEWQQLYYRTHATAVNARQRKYDHSHRAQRTAYMRQWREKNREADNAYHREYQKKRRLGATNTKTAKVAKKIRSPQL